MTGLMRNLSQRVVLRWLTSSARGLAPDGLIGLAVTGQRTGIVHRFPVQAVPDPGGLLVVAADPDRKLWWRNLGGPGPHRIEFCEGGSWRPADAELLLPGDTGYVPAMTAYLHGSGAVSRSAPTFEGAPVVRVLR